LWYNVSMKEKENTTQLTFSFLSIWDERGLEDLILFELEAE